MAVDPNINNPGTTPPFYDPNNPTLLDEEYGDSTAPQTYPFQTRTTGNAGPSPYGLDRYGNPLPPPGAGNIAYSGSVQYNPDGSLASSSMTDNPAGAQASAPQTPYQPKSGNVQTDWTNFLSSKGYTGAQGRTNLSQYVDEFNKLYGYSAKAGNPNASGQTDTIDFGNGAGWTDVIHGGDNAWQWLVEGNGQGNGQGNGSAGSAPSLADLTTVAAPYVAPARTFSPSDILNQAGPNDARSQSLMDLLNGIATGSRPESANANFTIDPNDPIIKNQVDAFDAAQQRSNRNAQDALAEKEGTHANLSAENRHAAETSGQATGAYQAGLIGNELTQRRQEAQQALAQYSQYMTADQQRQAQMRIAQLQNAEQQYEFDNAQGQSGQQFTAAQLLAAKQFAANLGQNAYQFDTQQQFNNSPLGS